MKFLAWCLMLLLSFASVSHAGQALPVSPMQNVTSGVIQQKMKQRGFAANDPRYDATIQAVSNGLSAAAGAGAAAVVVGAVTAPAWFTVALAAGIAGVVTYAVSVGIDSLTQWAFNSDNQTITVKAPNTPSGALIANGPYWNTSINSVKGSDPNSVISTALYLNCLGNTYTCVPYNCVMSTSTKMTCSIRRVYQDGNQMDTVYGIAATYYSSGSQFSCPTGQVYYNNSCIAEVLPAAQPQTKTPQQIVDSLSSDDRSRPLNPEIVSGIIDKAWRDAAAQPGYNGIPYSPANPVTKQDVETWKQNNPDSYPTVQDFVQPQPADNQPWKLPTSEAPVQTQSPSTTSTTTNPASSQPQTNLGDDPNIGTPELEPIPTAQQILQPILDLFPSLKDYSPNMSSGTCPQETLHLFGGTQTMNAHCQLLEENKSAIQQAMVLFYSLLALFIILSA